MKCKYLNQFRLSEFEWTIESCTANESPYTPSISELNENCKNSGFEKCSILLKKESRVFKNNLIPENFLVE